MNLPGWLVVYLSISVCYGARKDTSDAKKVAQNPPLVPNHYKNLARSICPESSVEFLSVLPGVGWDNLVNEERGPTINRGKYDKCQTSLDGRFLIPDEITVEPKKNSEVDMSSDVIDSTVECKSLTAASINSAMDLSYSSFKINGDFSVEKESIRENMKTSHGLIVRTHLRHKRYSVLQMPDSSIHPRLRNRLLDIAAHLERGNVTVELIEMYDKGDTGSKQKTSQENLVALNEAMNAFYLADLIVRDYGTHSVSVVDAGGVLVKTDTLDDTSLRLEKKDRFKVAAAASASFANLFKVKSGMDVETNAKEASNYTKKVTHSRITSYGGPIFQANNMSLASWENGLDKDLVAIDRNGIPIYDLLTMWSLPELKEDLVLRLVKTIKSAVLRYYTANSIVGCLDPTSSFYDNNANVEAPQCSENNSTVDDSTNLPLGGVFQTCVGPKEICSKAEVKNPATGEFTCPQNYMAVQLLPSQTRSCVQICDKGSWNKKDDHCRQECAETQVFWCSLDPSVNKPEETNSPATLNLRLGSNGFFFGGLYTDKDVNLVTHQFTCPEHTWVLSIGRRIRICIAFDRVLGRGVSIPFGGFYSCRFGNPLVNIFSARNNTANASNPSDRRFYRAVGDLFGGNEFDSLFSEAWQKQCPRGFTAYPAAMEDMCQVYYCIPANTIRGERKRYLKRPPFVRPMAFYRTIGETLHLEDILDRPLTLQDSQGRLMKRSLNGNWEIPSAMAASRHRITDQAQLGHIVLGILLSATLIICVALGLTLAIDRRKRHQHLVPTEA